MQAFFVLTSKTDPPEIIVRTNEMTFAENTEILWTKSIPTKEIKYKLCVVPQQWSNNNKNSSNIFSLELLSVIYV